MKRLKVFWIYLLIVVSCFVLGVSQTNIAYAVGQLLEEQQNINAYKIANPSVVTIKSDNASGAGCIVSPNGIVVTNKHVIQFLRQVQVCLVGDICYSANIIYGDNDDLVLLKINANNNFPYLKIADSSSIQVGQRVLAIGNPFGLDRTLTTGIISRIDYKRNRIQTDAAINPGNSGGPLLNTKGEMIGINQAILNPSGKSNAGIGFAIPSNKVQRLLVLSKNADISHNTNIHTENNSYKQPLRKPIVYHNKVFLGLTAIDNKPNQVVITGIVPASPAFKSGLWVNDILISVDSVKITKFDDVGFALQDKKPGDLVYLVYMRDGILRNAHAKLVLRH